MIKPKYYIHAVIELESNEVVLQNIKNQDIYNLRKTK